MGVVIPQVVTEDRASEAQFIDGGLRFDASKSHYLTRTPSSAGNRNTWTWSGWFKKNLLDNVTYWSQFFSAGTASDYSLIGGYINNIDDIGYAQYQSGTGTGRVVPSALYRDTSAWYHMVVAYDLTQATAANRIKLYINGTQITALASTTYPNQNAGNSIINNNVAHYINGRFVTYWGSAQYSQFYFIDGQALDPSSFGYTDPLTNTWRPKRYTGTYGTNGFYLPMDGNTPIGQDRSGNNNNWTPVNFGGSNTLEKATGALPILNTDGGGKVARVGVRTDSNASSLVLALPLVGIKSDFSNAINSGTSNKAVTANGNAAASSAQSNFYGGSFYFDGSGDYLSIPTSTDFAFGTGDFTIEFYTYLTTTGQQHFYEGRNGSSTNTLLLNVDTSTQVSLYVNGAYRITGQALLTGKWYHIALARSGTSTRLFVDGVQTGSTYSDTTNYAAPTGSLFFGANDVPNSSFLQGYLQDIRVYKGVAKYTQNFIPASTDPDILPDTPSGVSYSSNVALVPSTDGAVAFDGTGDYLSLASNADFAFGTGDFTIEAFCYKQSGKMFVLFDHLMGVGNFTIFAYADDVIQVYNNQFLSSGANPGNNKWFHLAVVRQSGVLSFYIDGIKAPTTHTFTYNFTTAGANIGVTQYGEYSTGFISNLHIVKGTALYTSNFTPPTAPITSVANTKLLCCKSQTSATAFDVSPGTITANGNATASNFNPFTVNINTQRGQESGYCTLDPLSKSSNCTLSDGNLMITSSSASEGGAFGNISVPMGSNVKYYFEMFVTNLGTNTSCHVGVADFNTASNYSSGNFSFYRDDGVIDGASCSSYTTGDTIGVAVDCLGGSVSYYKNGIFQKTSTISTYNIAKAQVMTRRTNGTSSLNFGQKPFKFPPPTGFQPLALANTPRPSIVRPDQYVGIVTYTGNDTTQNINVGWKPDLIWIKKRSSSSNSNHILVDTVRGASTILSSSGTFAESTFDATWRSNWGDVTSFNRDGFTVADGSSADGNINGLNQTYVAWAWKAGGNSNTYNINDVGYATASAAGLTAGTITPTGASVNTKSGFSIISFTAQSSGSASISHGLGNAPGFIIVKSRDQTYNWLVYHKNLTSNAYYLILNSTAGQDNASNAWNSTSPTSSVFTLGSTYAGSGNTIAYLWAEIPGFSKFGSYTGNGSTDGVTVVTGFRPAVVLMKKTSGISNWFMHDSGRNRYNAMTSILFSNLADQEDNTYGYIDFLSNGFKLRFQNTDYNTGSATYIYAAFAETPSFNLYGGQANAR